MNKKNLLTATVLSFSVALFPFSEGFALDQIAEDNTSATVVDGGGAGGTFDVVIDASADSQVSVTATNIELDIAGTNAEVVITDGDVQLNGTVDVNGGLFTADTGATISGGTTTTEAITASGAVNIDDVTTSTSSTTGALIVDGGVGIAENANIGGALDVTGATNTAAITASGVVNIDATTTSTTNTTGALVVDGGVGIAENVNIGGTLTSAGLVTGNAGATFTGGGFSATSADAGDSIAVAGDQVLLTSGTNTVAVDETLGTTVTGIATLNAGGGTAELITGTNTVTINGVTDINGTTTIDGTTTITSTDTNNTVTVSDTGTAIANTVGSFSATASTTATVGAGDNTIVADEGGETITLDASGGTDELVLGEGTVAITADDDGDAANGRSEINFSTNEVRLSSTDGGDNDSTIIIDTNGGANDGIRLTSGANSININDVDNSVILTSNDNVSLSKIELDDGNITSTAGATLITQGQVDIDITATTGTLTATGANGNGLTANATQTTVLSGANGLTANAAGATVGAENNKLVVNSVDNSVRLTADDDGNASNGRANVSLSTTQAALTLTNSSGETHGLTVSGTQTVLSGGTSSTLLTLDDNGASFSNGSGGPAKVTGVAAGTSTYDAVNFGQLQDSLRRVQSGVAATSAMVNIPQVEKGKRVSIGAGYGTFMDSNAIAIGASVRVGDNAIVKTSFAHSRYSKPTFGVGVGYSW